MSTHIRDFDDLEYDGPVFEKLAHHTLPRRPRMHTPVQGMVDGRRIGRKRYLIDPVTRARREAEKADRERAKQERIARMTALRLSELQDHFDRRRMP